MRQNIFYFSKDLNYLTDEKHTELNSDINEVKAMLISLIGKVRA